MYTLCEKVQGLTPYAPLSGQYRIRLDANESYFTPDAMMMERFAKELARLDLNRYPDPYAVEACKAFAEFYGVPESSVTAGNGSDELIGIICGSLLQKGDKLLTFSPDFSMYQFYGEIYELETLALSKGDSLQLDVDEAIRFIQENGVSAVIFSNPCNPTSLGLSREKVRKLIRSTEALVVLDEAYMDFWDQSMLPETQQYDNLIVLKTCSKAIGMAAIRLGFAVAKPTLTLALRAVKSPYNVNSMTQLFGAQVLGCKEYLDWCCKALVKSREALQQGLEGLAARFPALKQVYPSCTNFVFVRCSAANTIQTALAERSIAVRCFDGYLRITAGSSEENAAFLAALTEILAKEGKA